MLNVDSRYTPVAVALHWAIAALIGVNLLIGSFMERLPNPLRGTVVYMHLSFGVTVLALTLLRVFWRLSHRPPMFAAGIKPWESHLAHTVHLLFYLLMLGMPVTGWLILSANLRRPMMLYGLWIVPPYTPFSRLPAGPDKAALHDSLVSTHSAGAWIMLALLLLHLGGVLKHQLLDRSPQLARMWFERGAGPRRFP